MEISIPLETGLIPLIIGYMYHYLKSNYFEDIITLKSLLLGIVSGFLIAFITLLITFINTPFFKLEYIFVGSFGFYIIDMLLGVILVIIGGLFAITIKSILKK
jgi:hypothetical protein